MRKSIVHSKKLTSSMHLSAMPEICTNLLYYNFWDTETLLAEFFANLRSTDVSLQ